MGTKVQPVTQLELTWLLYMQRLLHKFNLGRNREQKKGSLSVRLKKKTVNKSKAKKPWVTQFKYAGSNLLSCQWNIWPHKHFSNVILEAWIQETLDTVWKAWCIEAVHSRLVFNELTVRHHSSQRMGRHIRQQAQIKHSWLLPKKLQCSIVSHQKIFF